MEDSFKVRVDRAFGSLEATAAPSSIKSTSSSLWCLTDQEIERNEWIQLHKDKEPKPPSSSSSSSSSSFLHPDLQSDIQDDQQPLEDHSNDEWNILRSSLGMDCTLDNEEEEDGFDKVALGGEEEEEERFYMRDVNDYEVEIDSNNELPNSFTDAIRDPRANLMAAKLRLKEDDDESVAAVVPDYVRNPSKYTHYTFDSMDDLDEESNKKAYIELLNSVKSRDDESMDDIDDVDDVSSTSIVFTPRNRSSDDGSINKSKVNLNLQKKKKKKKVVPMISIAAESEAEEVCVMEEEDEPEMASNKTTGGRKYRTKNAESDNR